jgi:NAD(P)-dependent dehydrogenase (short-subunit alcohol dehydrogenase family)
VTGLLSGRTAVVTGGANGMGAAIVRTFAAAGATRGAVVDLPGAFGASESPRGWIDVGVDLRDDASIAAGFEQVRASLGRVGVLVAAAGIVPQWTRLGELDRDLWDDVQRVNARGVLGSIQEVMPAMDEGGAIVVIASQNAWIGNANLTSYVASKHAVLGLVRSAALELGLRGIRVNAIAPGSVATDAYVSRLRLREGRGGLAVEQALARDAEGTALKRLATPDEVADAVLFLASPMASAITGHMLPVGAAA